jgi:hypothetical protein
MAKITGGQYQNGATGNVPEFSPTILRYRPTNAIARLQTARRPDTFA